jgi:alanyl aminopeptidase
MRRPRFLTGTLVALVLLPAGLHAQPAPPGARGDVRLGDDVLPTFEAIHLRVDPAEKEYRGTVAVDLTARRTIAAFHFHALGETLAKVALTGPGGKGEAIPLRTEVDERGLVTAHPSHPLVPGAYRLEIAFTQAFNTRSVGLYRTEKDGRSYAFTQLEAADARRAFPCWDEPGVKLPYQLTVEVPAAHLAVSNTPIEKETPESGAGAAGFKTVVFKRTPPLPAYLLALASGPLEATPIPGLSVPGRVITVAGQSRLAGTAVQLAPPLLAALERWFGRPYPFEKLDLIAAPEFWPGAMENPGAIVFADKVLLLDPARVTGHDRLELAYITAHEIAHQWFGDLVTMTWWDDLWLNESFADWVADKITDEVYPQWKQETAVLVRIHAVMAQDARPSATPMRRPIASPDEVLENTGVLYEKGKAVLAMFEAFLGPETFRRGVQDYLREHAWGNATANDLWSALGHAAGRDVGAIMSTFVDQPGLPLVRVELLPGGRIALSQERFTNAGAPAPPLTWKIPVGLKYGDGTEVRQLTVLLESAHQEVSLPGGATWVMPDLGGAGYYRWSLPPERLTQLAAQVATRLDARERIAFLCNLSALLSAGLVHGDTFLAATTPFATDPEPLVVDALLSQLAGVRQALVPETLADPFTAYVRRTFRPLLDRIGREARSGEGPNVPGLRSRLLLWLGDEGRDPEVLHYGETLARRYLAAPESVDPELVEPALALAALNGDRALFEEYRRHFESARSPVERSRYLQALGRFRDPAVQDEFLRFALAGNLRPNELLRAAKGLGETERGADRFFLWVRENYPTLAKRLPPIFLPGLPIVAGGCSAARLEEGKRFFAEPGHQVPGTAYELERIGDQVHECLQLREREEAAVAGFLKGDGTAAR